SPLLVQYDKHLEEMSEQLQLYQVWMLHADLKEAVEKQLETLPFVGTDISADEEIVRNLQEQLQLASQEKEHALQLWQSISREFDELQQQYQQHMTETQIHVAEKKKQKDQLTGFQQLTQQLHVANEKIELVTALFLFNRSELSQQKLRTQELLSQLEIANEKAIEDEKLMMEYREYINRLQRRLSQAEQRAATASQKLSVITAHKKAAASLQELENT
uniref:Sodium channel and clathrin linker 1 n=1 Tax=Nothoprocta perdicaria TaxID=30464 RepID=A0A8C7EEU8_NOTPE